MNRGRGAGRRRALGWLALVLVLAVENVWMFGDHYAGRKSIPWDFSLTYYTVPFYWQALARLAQFPRWVPFQSFGYPLALNTQSGLFYPPLWLFVLFRITYSMRAAIAFQWLHVLGGALGAGFLARTRRLGWAATLLAGSAYQFFGGFYGNAEHADIVRGYALVPWLLAALTLEDDETPRRLAPRNWLVAPVVLLLCTGAYPGQLPATLLLGGLYLGLQILDGAGAGWPDRAALGRRLRVATLRLAMIGLGVALSAASLLPGWCGRGEISRSAQLAGTLVDRSGLDLDHLFTTLFSCDLPALGGDISMRSLFVTVPILLGLFFVRWASLVRQRALVVVGLTAALLIQAGGVYRLLAQLLPTLGLSRFPSSDYRALVAVPMVLMGALGWSELLRPPSDEALRGLAVRALAVLGFLVWGGQRFHWPALDARQLGELGFVVVASWMLVALALRRALPPALLLALALALVAYDGGRMQHRVELTWIGRPDLPGYDLASDYERARRELQHSASEPRSSRPARAYAGKFGGGSANLEGYLRGRFIADDYAASDNFRIVAAVRNDPALLSFLIAESAPRLVATPDVREVHAALAAPSSAGAGAVAMTRFAATELRYRLSSATEAILVENEPAYAGWSAVAACGGPAEQALAPVASLWPLRAWRVPAGDSDICVRFAAPGAAAGVALSCLALALWLASIGWRYRSGRRYSNAPGFIAQ